MTEPNIPEIESALQQVWDKMLGAPVNPDFIAARPELTDFIGQEIRRQVKLATLRSPAGLTGLFPGLGTRKR